jgi:hypothetical protein
VGRSEDDNTRTRQDEYSATASPNSRWLAFVSNDTGAYEVYVKSCPKAGSRQRISTGGGFFPQWRADGKELYYSTPDNTLMAIEVHGDGAEFAAGTPNALFPLKAAAVYSLGTFWQPMHDGRRFHDSASRRARTGQADHDHDELACGAEEIEPALFFLIPSVWSRTLP